MKLTISSIFVAVPGPFSCNEDKYHCSGAKECIPRYQVCDGVFDCKNKDDEAQMLCTTGMANTWKFVEMPVKVAPYGFKTARELVTNLAENLIYW